MTTHSAGPRDRRRLQAAGLLLLAMLAMGWILGDQFVQDDAGVIVANPLVREWAGIWRAFGAAYWPPIHSGELYRPLSIALFTAEWQLGGGAPLLFRLVSLALYAGTVLLVWRLLRLLVSDSAAWLGAALFAVHPVHTEAVAVAVNQSELGVGLLLLWAVTLRIEADRSDTPVARPTWAIWAIFVVAVFTKEHALVLPGLLLAADHFLHPGGRTLARLQRWQWSYGAILLSGALFWLVRTYVLGPGAGTRTAEALDGLTMAGRAFTMVGVPAEWLRLFLWPAHLQTDWNLLEWVPARAWSVRETAGALAIASFLGALALVWRRRPVAAFGLAWMVVALAPVANILLPTGIVLAERTLFLPSIGFVIVMADLLAAAIARWPAPPRPLRSAAVAAAGLVLGLGVVRSAVRMRDWVDRPVFLAVQTIDAPTSWRARIAHGLMLADYGDTVRARIEVRRALALRTDNPLAPRDLVDRMRRDRGECAGPVIIYEEILRALPGRSDVRGSLVACLLHLGRYAEARAEAERGVASGLDADYFRYVVTVADSAVTARAPAGTVRLRPVGRRVTEIGGPVGPP